MENGIGIAEVAKSRERNSVNSQELEPSLDESMDFDENEVFEEVVEANTPPENSILTARENRQLIGSTDNNEGNSDVFHEAVGTPSAFQSSDGTGFQTQDFIVEKHLDTERTLTGERNRLLDNGSDFEGEKDNYSVIVGSAAAVGETQNLDDGNDILEKSNQKLEVDISIKKKSFLEALTSGDSKTADVDKREDQVDVMSQTLESNELNRDETNPKKHEFRKNSDEVKEIPDDNKIGGDVSSITPDNGSLGHESLVGAMNHELEKIESADAMEEQIHEKSSEIKDEERVDPRSELESSLEALHENEQDGILGSAHPLDKHEIESVGLYPVPKEGEGVENKKSCLSSADVKDDATTYHANEDSGLDTVLRPEPDDSNLVKEVAEVKPHFSSRELVESSSLPQPNLVDSHAKVSANVIEQGEGKEGGEKDNKKEQMMTENKEKEVTAASGESSASGLSTTRPASDAVEMQGSVSKDTSANAKLETKPAHDVSSSAKSGNPSPAGLGHTGQLLDHVSENKDIRPRSTTAIPSTNISATPARPAGLGRAAPLLEPTSRVVQHPRVNGAVSATQNQLVEDPTNGEAEEYDETREKLQMIRVKFLRLAHRLGQTPHNVVVAQVLYRLGLAEQLHGRSGGRVAAFSFDRASAMAEQLEAAGQEPLDFTCTIMVLGKSGVGKSATINSIFDESMFGTDAFELGTKKVQDVVGTVQGIRVRVIDTPGLLPSWSDQHENERILRSVKRFIKKTPPDIVLYLDRLDMQNRDFGDMPLLRTITDIFGPSIWFNAIVVLTHAASAPPEGPNGSTTSYDMFVTQRSHVVQQAIRQAAGDMRLMNPVSLVENHSACRTNRAGQRVLPNGQVWKPHLLLLSFASKILAEANTLLKLQDTPPGRPFAPRTRSPPLPVLLSSLLQSRPEVQLPSEQFGDDDDDVLDDLDECSDSEEESEYDKLPPFKSLTNAQLEKLSKLQRKAYYDELELRERLFMKKQLKEERKRRKMMRKMQEAAKNLPFDFGDNGEEETNAAASVPVPIPDLALPASFDSDNPTYRYRSLDSSNPWLVRAVQEPHGWDHDIGYDGINVERFFVVKDRIPISFSGHISKDKKDANLQMEIASSVKHGKGKATSLGFDMQSVGKDYAYMVRGETKFSNHRMNKAIAGLSATILGDVITGGMKVEDKLIIGKQGQLVVSGGAIYGRGEVAYGGSLEATLRDKDHPLGRFLSTLGLSIMDWHGDVAVGFNSQTQIPVGRTTNLIGRFNLNNKGSGQLSIKVNSSEQLQIVLIGLIPLAKKILGYSQQVQYG